MFWGIFSDFKFPLKDFPTNKPRWRKFAPGPVRLISAAGLQAAQRVQNAANQKRLRDRARAVAAPVRGNALPLPPPVEADSADVGDGGDGGDEGPVLPGGRGDGGDEGPVLPAGRGLGCTKCRFAAIGCKQCQNPRYTPRGKGRGKAQPKAQPKAKAKGRGRGRGRGRANPAS